MPTNDVSAPHPQHTYAANAARLSCLLPPPPRLDIVAVSTSPSPLNGPHASRTRPAPLLPLPAVHTTSATRVRMAKLARTYDERPSNVQINPLAWITRQRRCAASTAAASPVISSGPRRGCFNPDLKITRRMLGVHLVVLRPRRARPITTGYLLCKPVDPSGFQGATVAEEFGIATRVRRLIYKYSIFPNQSLQMPQIAKRTIHSVDTSNDPEVIRQLLRPFGLTPNATTRLDEISVLHRCQIIDLYQRKRPSTKPNFICFPASLGVSADTSRLRISPPNAFPALTYVAIHPSQRYLDFPQRFIVGRRIKCTDQSRIADQYFCGAPRELPQASVMSCQHSDDCAVLGARAEFTSAVAYMYEVILHRLPNVKNLHILFCDNLGGSQGHVVKDVVLCKRRDCQNSSAHMIHEYIDHAYVKHLSRGNDFKAPDLCILMNGYIANHETALWSETISLLLERGGSKSVYGQRRIVCPARLRPFTRLRGTSDLRTHLGKQSMGLTGE
ncbi:hypothetical protein R3P38DRAFT_3361757 [Favolaschia claudopus]|uniref:Uncharacterized protein n=1 Tax=Favolaschia claudopus TaxID=2862362 RepID=A0AAW0ASQ8_9AGAR